MEHHLFLFDDLFCRSFKEGWLLFPSAYGYYDLMLYRNGMWFLSFLVFCCGMLCALTFPLSITVSLNGLLVQSFRCSIKSNTGRFDPKSFQGNNDWWNGNVSPQSHSWLNQIIKDNTSLFSLLFQRSSFSSYSNLFFSFQFKHKYLLFLRNEVNAFGFAFKYGMAVFICFICQILAK